MDLIKIIIEKSKNRIDTKGNDLEVVLIATIDNDPVIKDKEINSIIKNSIVECNLKILMHQEHLRVYQPS